MSLRILIVDDERIARQRLRRLLAALPGCEVVGEAQDGVEALERARELRPDLVLLDIRMPGMDGIQAARELGSSAHVVFTTAHDEHAVSAFEAAAADYLLKPIRPERLAQAIERVRKLRERQDPAALETLLRSVLDKAPSPASPARLSARRGDVIELFDPAEIGRLHAEAGYVVFSQGGREYVLDESLNALEERLSRHGFVRVHRSELVNLSLVRALHRQDDQAIAELTDGQRAPVSRSHLPELKRRLGLA